jgi:MFS transporter, FSR family, fosmidomycin resistance protein
MRTLLLLLVVFLGHFCVDFFMGIWPVYKSVAGLDLVTAGVVFGLAGLFGDSMQLVTGVLGDKGYRKRSTLLGILLGAAMIWGLTTTRPLPLFMSIYAMFIGSALFHPNAAAIVSGLSERRKGMMMSIFASGGFLGLAIGPRLFAKYYDQLQPWMMLLPVVVLCLIGLLLKVQESGKRERTLRQQVAECREALSFHGRSIRLLWAAQASLAAATYGWSFLIPDLLLSKGYSGAMAMGGAHFWMIFGCALVVIPIGMLSDRIGQRRVILTAGALTVALWYMFLALPPMAGWISVPYLFVMGSALGVMNPLIVAYGNRLIPNLAGSVSALLMGGAWCFGYLGITVASLLPGLFSNNATVHALQLFGLFIVVPPLMAVLLSRTTVQESVA